MALHAVNVLMKTLELFESEHGKDGVHVYDFADGTFLVPAMDITGSYLTKLLCCLYTRGDGPPERQAARVPMNDGEIIDYGNDWKFIAVDVPLGMTPEQLMASLLEKKFTLLGIRIQ